MWRLGLEEILRADVSGLADLPNDVRPVVVGDPPVELWRILLALTNCPCLSLHLKYLTPFTVPLCLPARRDNSHVMINPAKQQTSWSAELLNAS